VFSTRQHVGDVRVLLTARAMPLFVRKWSSTVHWKHHHMIFLPPWSVSMVVQQFIAGGFFYFYCLLFSLFRLKCMFVLFFNFIPYVFYCLFSSLTLLEKLYMFSIQSLNYNLSYIVFTNSVIILLICHFYPWIFF
jgi:hypothetical protein